MESARAPYHLYHAPSRQPSFPQLPPDAFFPDDKPSFSSFGGEGVGEEWGKRGGDDEEGGVFGMVSVVGDHGKRDERGGAEGRVEEEGRDESRVGGRGRYEHAKDWAGEDDEGNPHNWPLRKKLFHTAVPAGFALVCTFASSVYTSGLKSTATEFNVSTEVSLLPYVLYILGLGFGPAISSPVSESRGRRIVYLTCMPIFALFVLGVGFAQNIETLCLCRFFAGVFGSPALAIGSATISEIWPPSVRAVPMAVYVWTPFMGPALGPLIGGFVVEKKGWRWTQWVTLFFVVAVYVPALFIEETYKTHLLKRRAKAHNIEGPPVSDRTFSESITFFLTSTLTRPLHMLCVEPVVLCFSIYIAFNFALQYSFFTAFPLVFEDVYGFNLGAQGLTFMGLGIGCCVGLITVIFVDRLLYRPKAAKAVKVQKIKAAKAEKAAKKAKKPKPPKPSPTAAKLPPEHRLYYALIGAPFIPLSLFWFGFTAKKDILWLSPVVAEAFFGFGNCLVFQSSTMYIMDFYGPQYGASAMGANALLRYALSTIFPLFSLEMYGFVGGKGLGIAGASALLGGVSVLLACIPGLFWWVGPRLRGRSRFRPGA